MFDDLPSHHAPVNTNVKSIFNVQRAAGHLLVDLLHVQALHAAVQVSKGPLVGRVLAVEVVLLGGDEALGAAAHVRRLADGAGPGGRGFVGTALRVT